MGEVDPFPLPNPLLVHLCRIGGVLGSIGGGWWLINYVTDVTYQWRELSKPFQVLGIIYLGLKWNKICYIVGLIGL